MSVTTTYAVSGMTCGHCVAAVTDELSKLPGVGKVDVDLATGKIVVESADALDPALVASAIDEAGFEVVS